jgi:hypothetical protein
MQDARKRMNLKARVHFSSVFADFFYIMVSYTLKIPRYHRQVDVTVLVG